MAGGPAPFTMPVKAPKPVEFGGQLPYTAPRPAPVQPMPARGSRPGAAAPRPPGNAPRPAAGGTGGTGGGWGAQTATFQQQFPSLRHTSGYRSPEHNARTPGASKTSYHMQRDAQGNSRANDYVGSAKDMAAAGAWAKSNGAREVLIHNAGTGQHLHIAWRHRMGQAGLVSDESLRNMQGHQRPGRVLSRHGLSGGPATSVHSLL